MHYLDNIMSCDYYIPDPNKSQTEPITFYPDIYSDAMGAVQQLEYKDSCSSYNQTQFRIVAENLNDQGTIISYPV